MIRIRRPPRTAVMAVRGAKADERIRREVVCAFRGIIFKRLIIRHSEIMLLHDNYIGTAVLAASAECRFTPDSP